MEVSRASFASADETMELTGMMIGGVTPFGLPEDLPIYADAKLRDLDYVILGGGSRSFKLKMAPAELGKLGNLEFIEGLSLPPRGSYCLAGWGCFDFVGVFSGGLGFKRPTPIYVGAQFTLTLMRPLGSEVFGKG